MTKSASILNDVCASPQSPNAPDTDVLPTKLVDKHLLMTVGSRDERGAAGLRRRGMGRQGSLAGDWDRMH